MAQSDPGGTHKKRWPGQHRSTPWTHAPRPLGSGGSYVPEGSEATPLLTAAALLSPRRPLAPDDTAYRPGATPSPGIPAPPSFALQPQSAARSSNRGGGA